MNYGKCTSQPITGKHPKVIKVLCNSVKLYLSCLGTNVAGLVVTLTYDQSF